MLGKLLVGVAECSCASEVASVARSTRQLYMMPNNLKLVVQAWGVLVLGRWPRLHFFGDASGLAEIVIGVAVD